MFQSDTNNFRIDVFDPSIEFQLVRPLQVRVNMEALAMTVYVSPNAWNWNFTIGCSLVLYSGPNFWVSVLGDTFCTF